MKNKVKRKILLVCEIVCIILILVSGYFIVKKLIEEKKSADEFGGLIDLIPTDPVIDYTPAPSITPAPTPTEIPTPELTPTPEETPEPTPTPTPEETPAPTPTPEAEETPEPTPTPEAEETPELTPTPEETPTPTPTPVPTPTPEPTPTPTVMPTSTPAPTANPYPTPTPFPTAWTVDGKYQNVYQQNNDLVGWIKIDDTKINYPVMQSSVDPNYYLYRNFEKQDSSYGVPYVSGYYDIKTADNVVLYGHHMKNGSMFSNLAYLETKGKSYYNTHKYVQFDILGDDYGTYEIFAVFTTKDETTETFYYSTYINFADENEFNEYVSTVKKRSLYNTGITPVYGEKLLTLVTCEFLKTNGKGRVVVVARKIQ